MRRTACVLAIWTAAVPGLFRGEPARWRTFLIIISIAMGMTGPAHAAAAAETVDIEVSNFKFEPRAIRLEHGRAYILRLHNRSGFSHDFVARDFFNTAEISMGDRSKFRTSDLDLAGGETVEVHLVAPPPGTFKFHCSHPLHSTLGMKGTIEVD